MAQHCATVNQKIWSGCYVLTWILLFIGLLVYHLAISSVYPALADLPDNLRAGFYIIFKFDYLEADSLSVKQQAAAALLECDITPTMCENLPTPPVTKTSTTSTHKASIVASFDNSLNVIKDIGNDPYFGVNALVDVSNDLVQITNDLEGVQAVDAPCVGSNQLYCNIYTSSTQIVQSTSSVTAELDKFIDSEQVREFKNHSDKLAFLHALPYVMVISGLFFLCFWVKDGTCCCCKGGSCSGCLLVIGHFLFWLTFFIINTIILVVCYAIMNFQGEINLDVLNGKPTIEVFLAHLKTRYPAFWAKVFADFEEGGLFLYQACILFEIVCIVLPVYGICMCLCNPYKPSDDKVVDVSSNDKP
jgi:hypothetical protein